MKIPIGRPHKSQPPSKIAKSRTEVAIAITTRKSDVEVEQSSMITVAAMTADNWKTVHTEDAIRAMIDCICEHYGRVPKDLVNAIVNYYRGD